MEGRSPTAACSREPYCCCQISAALSCSSLICFSNVLFCASKTASRRSSCWVRLSPDEDFCRSAANSPSASLSSLYWSTSSLTLSDCSSKEVVAKSIILTTPAIAAAHTTGLFVRVFPMDVSVPPRAPNVPLAPVTPSIAPRVFCNLNASPIPAIVSTSFVLFSRLPTLTSPVKANANADTLITACPTSVSKALMKPVNPSNETLIASVFTRWEINSVHLEDS